MGWADAFATGFLKAGDEIKDEQERRRRYQWEDEERRMQREQFEKQQELTRRAIMREDRAQADERARRAMESVMPGQEISKDIFDIIKEGGYLGRLGQNAPRAATPSDVEGPQMGSYVYQGSMPELQQKRSFDMGQQLQEAQLQNAILGNQQGQWQLDEGKRNRASEVSLEQWMQQNPTASPEQIMRKSIEFGAQPPGGVGQLYGGQLQREQWRQQFNPNLYNARYGRVGGRGQGTDPYQEQAVEDLSNLPLTRSALEGELAQKYAMLANPPKNEEGAPISPASAAEAAWPSVFNQRMQLQEQTTPGFVAGTPTMKAFFDLEGSIDQDLASGVPYTALIQQAKDMGLSDEEVQQYALAVMQAYTRMQEQEANEGFMGWLRRPGAQRQSVTPRSIDRR